MEKDCAIVTGGGRGIGREIALQLARDGNAVIVNFAHSADAAEKTVYDIKKEGGEATAVKANVSVFEEAEKLVATAKELYGNIYILINNAGVTRDGLIMRMSKKDYDDVLYTNLKGAFNCTRHVSAVMLKQRRGRIINISSVVGLMGNAGQANYAASKAGLIGLTKSVARELAPRAITCNAVAPGYIETEMTQVLSETVRNKTLEAIPLKRMGSAQEVAKLVSFLCSESGSYITGQTLAIDGGMSI